MLCHTGRRMNRLWFGSSIKPSSKAIFVHNLKQMPPNLLLNPFKQCHIKMLEKLSDRKPWHAAHRRQTLPLSICMMLKGLTEHYWYLTTWDVNMLDWRHKCCCLTATPQWQRPLSSGMSMNHARMGHCFGQPHPEGIWGVAFIGTY